MPDRIRRFSFGLLLLLVFAFVLAETEEQTDKVPELMNNDRLDAIIRRFSDEIEGRKGYWQFSFNERNISVITDEKSDRLRIIIPVASAKQLNETHLYRIMQANFDSALDARYAIAKEILWSAYIHPLSSLNEQEFLLGLGQTINLANTFGTSFTSGLMQFEGGDSKALQERKLIEEILRQGQAI